ncbi:SIS domain-containing protein [Leucobacter albus]|uniref:SIS domain-containing protein n=1 Tax=Leucobacter albus TaxID=272210 RepID=A0ABW3TM36_9MICO
MTERIVEFHDEVARRLAQLARTAEEGGFDAAISLLSDTVAADGVIHAFGTGHSEAFAMEVAGRAGGLIPTNKVALRDVVIRGDRDVSALTGYPPLERDPEIGDELFATILREPQDAFIIASNSGVNGSIVGMALRAQKAGHPVIAVTSLEHTARVTPTHPSGKRLSEIADIVIDNLAPYGDAVLARSTPLGAVSSITSAFIAQLLTVGISERLERAGQAPPVFLSANIPGGDEHNRRHETHYGERIRRIA